MIYIKRWIDYYEDLFTIEPNQLEFFEKLASEFSTPIKLLSVECGPGQLSGNLAKNNGFEITAVDTYQEFVNICNTRLRNLEKAFPVFNLNPADIGRYLGKNFFNIMYCLNYRIIFLKDRAMIKKFMLDAKLLLKEGGYLVLDLFNFSKYDFSETKIDLPVRKGQRSTLYTSVVKNTESMDYRLYQHVVTNSGKVIDEVKDEPVCPISLETFKTFANELEFTSIEFYSDYFGHPLDKDSDKIICVLKK